MAGINKVMIVGRVGRDPKIRSTSGGTEFANLSVATSETWRDRHTGEKKEKTEWHWIVVWGEGAVKVIRDYVQKGDLIGITASVRRAGSLFAETHLVSKASDTASRSPERCYRPAPRLIPLPISQP